MDGSIYRWCNRLVDRLTTTPLRPLLTAHRPQAADARPS